MFLPSADENDKHASCPLCIGADPAARSALQRLLAPGQSRFIAQTSRFVAVPTFGCFVAGYLLVVPRVHVLSFGQLDPDALAEADELIRRLAKRITAAYDVPVLGFEYGINTRGVRRIEHAHWHLLPSSADLSGWLGQRLTGRSVDGLASLPADRSSYIAVRDRAGSLTVFDIDGPLEVHRRIRLRRVVAALDPRVEGASWDWAEQRCPELIRQTIRDLGSTTTPAGAAK